MNLEAVKPYMRPSYVLEAVRHPQAALRLLRRSMSDHSKVGDVLDGIGRNGFREYLRELREDRALNNLLWGKVTQMEYRLRGHGATLGVFPRDACAFMYALVRSTKPESVVETGVASGMSSSYILAALESNSKGHLYSIDLPSVAAPGTREDATKQHVLSPNETGWLIPDRLRGRWTLLLRRSSEVLPALLPKIERVDVFLHDSAHSYENMMFEYQTVWPFLRDGGVLVSDNIGYNRAFVDFSSMVQATKFDWGSLGVLVRLTDP